MQFDAIRQARGQFAPNVVRHSGPLDSLSTRRAHPNRMEFPPRMPVSGYFDLVSCELRKDAYKTNADSNVLLDERPYFLLKVSGKLNSILPEMHRVQPDQNNCTSGQVFKLGKKNGLCFLISSYFCHPVLKNKGDGFLGDTTKFWMWKWPFKSHNPTSS